MQNNRNLYICKEGYLILLGDVEVTLLKNLNYDSVYWVLARIGGFDGVSLQTIESLKLLNGLGLNVDVISGEEETYYGSVDFNDNGFTLLDRLSFKHKDSKYLYNNSFERSIEKREIWEKRFHKHKEKIRKALEKRINEKPEAPVIIHNMLSLRPLHPAAAVAMKDIIEKYPERYFVNFAPDSDWERPIRMERIRHYVREIIASSPGLKDGTGPYNYKNLYHIVLNPVQSQNFHETYKVPKNRTYEIPDFLEFKSETLKKQIVQQIESTFPKDKIASSKEKVLSMDESQ